MSSWLQLSQVQSRALGSILLYAHSRGWSSRWVFAHTPSAGRMVQKILSVDSLGILGVVICEDAVKALFLLRQNQTLMCLQCSVSLTCGQLLSVLEVERDRGGSSHWLEGIECSLPRDLRYKQVQAVQFKTVIIIFSILQGACNLSCITEWRTLSAAAKQLFANLKK